MVKDKTNEKKNAALEMNHGTASNRLKKSILYNLLKLNGDNICYQCNKEIESADELSIEHKIPWLNSETPKELFWSLENIGFSHLKCNIGAAERKTGIAHPSQESYRRGCRCDECTEIQKLRMRKYRNNKYE